MTQTFDLAALQATIPAAPLLPAELLARAFLERFREPTRATYRRSLYLWVQHCLDSDQDPVTADRVLVERWLRQLEERGTAPATRARHLAALSGFFAEAVERGARDRNPVDRIRRPSISRDSQRLGLSHDEARRLLAAVGDRKKGDAREDALLCLFLLNGLRVSEALGIRRADLSMARGRAVVTVTRKGGARHVIPLAPRTERALREWLKTFDRWVAHLWDDREMRYHGSVFVRYLGPRYRRPFTPMTRFGARRAVRYWAKQAQIPFAVSPHSLRHTFVTLSLDAGVPLRDVQDSAGHADPRTTRRYDRGRYSLERHATHALARYLG